MLTTQPNYQFAPHITGGISAQTWSSHIPGNNHASTSRLNLNPQAVLTSTSTASRSESDYNHAVQRTLVLGAGSPVNVKKEIPPPDLYRSEIESRCNSPASALSESDEDVSGMESTMDLYFNVQIGVVSDLDQRDKTLSSLAVVKRSVAKTERRLAKYRMKEMSLIQHLHTVHENLAQKRQLQADLNIDRLGHYLRESRRSGTNNLNIRDSTALSEIASTLARPTESFL